MISTHNWSQLLVWTEHNLAQEQETHALCMHEPLMAVTFGRTCLDLRGKIEYSRKNEKGVIVLQGRPAAERQRNVEEYFTGVQAANAFLEKAAAEATAGLGLEESTFRPCASAA